MSNLIIQNNPNSADKILCDSNILATLKPKDQITLRQAELPKNKLFATKLSNMKQTMIFLTFDRASASLCLKHVSDNDKLQRASQYTHPLGSDIATSEAMPTSRYTDVSTPRRRRETWGLNFDFADKTG